MKIEIKRTTVKQVRRMQECAKAFDTTNKGTQHMLLTRLIDRVEGGADCQSTIIKFKSTTEEFMGKTA